LEAVTVWELKPPLEIRYNTASDKFRNVTAEE
jgi:hypothetical protein